MGKYGKRGCGVPESDLGPHQARFFPFPVALFFRIALVVHFLALGQADFGLDPTTLVMQIERHEGVSGAFDLADQAIDLCRVQEEFARSRRVGFDVGRSFGERRDVHAEDEEFAVPDQDVGLFDVRPSCADGLDLPAFECEPSLELLLDEVVVEGFLVGNDAHGWTFAQKRAGARDAKMLDSTGFVGSG